MVPSIFCFLRIRLLFMRSPFVPVYYNMDVSAGTILFDIFPRVKKTVLFDNETECAIMKVYAQRIHLNLVF